jgi:hypothetical protein
MALEKPTASALPYSEYPEPLEVVIEQEREPAHPHTPD